MRKLAAFCLLGIFVAMWGCKAGIQVVDNTYQSLGGQNIVVNDAFGYVGECDPVLMVTTDQGRAKANDGITTRGDVFVKESTGGIVEIVIVERASVTRRGYTWNPPKGEGFNFYGKEFKERFFDAKQGGPSVDAYINFLRSEGYAIDVPDLYVMQLSRKLNQRTLGKIYYGVYPGVMPESVQKDWGSVKNYLRDRITKVVSAS